MKPFENLDILFKQYKTNHMDELSKSRVVSIDPYNKSFLLYTDTNVLFQVNTNINIITPNFSNIYFNLYSCLSKTHEWKKDNSKRTFTNVPIYTTYFIYTSKSLNLHKCSALCNARTCEKCSMHLCNWTCKMCSTVILKSLNFEKAERILQVKKKIRCVNRYVKAQNHNKRAK